MGPLSSCHRHPRWVGPLQAQHFAETICSLRVQWQGLVKKQRGVIHIPLDSKISRSYSCLTSRNLVFLHMPKSEVSLWWRFSSGLWWVGKNLPDTVFVFYPEGTDLMSLQNIPTHLPDNTTEEHWRPNFRNREAFEILTAVFPKIHVFWIMSPCGLLG